MTATPEVSKELEAALQREVMYQSWTAGWAWNMLQATVEPPPLLREMGKDPDAHKGRMEIRDPLPQAIISYTVINWSIVRVMLSGASVVSRILWPLTKRPPEGRRERQAVSRAEELRTRWNLPPDSYLSNRDVRDVVEHVEDRLVEWIASHTDRPAEGLTIGAASDNPEFRRNCFRMFDPVTKTVYAGDKECDLAQVLGALREISEALPPIGLPVNIGIPKSWRANDTH